jgi:hypothetical protein
MHPPTRNQLSSASPAVCEKLGYHKTTTCQAVSLTLFDGVQAGYHTKKATKASKTVSARSPSHHGCGQH